jgi:hypothetical protein
LKVCSKAACPYKGRNPTENYCEFAHHDIEVENWKRWCALYKQKTAENMDANLRLQIADYLNVSESPNLKRALNYYHNEKYTYEWYQLVDQIGELNYETLMHGMIYNEMNSCADLVETMRWRCEIDAFDSELLLSLTPAQNAPDYQFHNNSALMQYVKILRIKYDGKEFDSVIWQTSFDAHHAGNRLSVVIDTENKLNKANKRHYEALKSTNAADIECTLLLNRSIFYLMHYAVDNANKSILFPPRIERANLSIEESLDFSLDDLKFNESVTNEQKTIIERILKEKSGSIVLPVSFT